MRLGIDEAGRGPVIGPLVIAAVSIPDGYTTTLTSRGIKDSKAIPAPRRSDLFEYIVEHYGYRAVFISPTQIDRALQNPSSSLNTEEFDTMQDLITVFDADTTVIDAPTKTSPWHEDNSIVYEHGADETYPVVGAASIIAKVLRDRCIDHLSDRLGVETGSGYPSDPETQAFLNTADLSAPYIRSEWATVKRRRRDQEQQTLINDEANRG